MADQIDINCPYCKGEIIIDREWIGQKGECPYCNRTFMLSDPASDQDDVSYDESVQSTTDESAYDAPRERNKFAGLSSLLGNSKIRKLIVLGIAGASLLALIVLGFVFLWDRHDKVQLWEDGPYWAKTNIGAEKSWESGYYFWWGDTVGYKREDNAWVESSGSKYFSFDEYDCPAIMKNMTILKSVGWICVAKNQYVLSPEHDAAHIHWGGKWRMPTRQEWDDLMNKCDWEWTWFMGVAGYVVRGRGDYASSSIFLPCFGYGSGTELSFYGSNGYYWSSVPNSDDNNAWCLFFMPGSKNFSMRTQGRYGGCSIRPVQGFTK